MGPLKIALFIFLFLSMVIISYKFKKIKDKIYICNYPLLN
ncbi:MAG: hypothetical protein BAJALOKI1v1_1600006 [Promethearchaeota archaeon]|nr:MAG: hypothetical protein BAJALOKI1v1_1600006 [Candidatus Lokiarchaeota archaeon]